MSGTAVAILVRGASGLTGRRGDGTGGLSAEQLFHLLTEIPFPAIFVYVALEAMRRRSRVNLDIAVFFGAVALIELVSWLGQVRPGTPPHVVSSLTGSLLISLAYLQLRLVDDFAGVPRRFMRATEVGLGASVVVIFAVSAVPAPLALVLVAYFLVLQGYVVFTFWRQSGFGSGVTRRRLQAAGIGGSLLGAVLFFAGLSAAAPRIEGLVSLLSQACGLGAGLAYVAAFATPPLLRRAWQEPQVRAFLARAATLSALPNVAGIVQAIERSASESLGAGAAVALWYPEEEALRAPSWNDDPQQPVLLPGQFVTGHSFAEQRVVFVPDAAAAFPDNAAVYRRYNVRALIAAPITAGDQRLGVLIVFAPRAPIFAREDIELVQLLADQAAVILQNRALIDEATRLRDEFLAAAAHDLRTPLTAVIGQAQLLERRARQRPDAPPDFSGIERLLEAADRLRVLVGDLLDVSRGDIGRLVGDGEPTDLAALAREVCARVGGEDARCTVAADGTVTAHVDAARVTQLLENLVSNAMKYSPGGEPVEVRVSASGGEAQIAVRDRGIGIAPADVPHVFDRFHRGENADQQHFPGLGLGLYIARLIAEQHGGRIWVDSTLGAGSTFFVALPVARAEAPVSELAPAD